MDQSLLLQTWQYVISAPNFWTGIGFLTATAMFVGGVLYNGDIPQAKKGIVSFLIYVAFVSWIGLCRKLDSFGPDITHPERVFASTIVILITTICYIFGIFLGVYIVSLKHKPK